MTNTDYEKFGSAEWYDYKYFADEEGKEFKMENGSVEHWGYRNPSGLWGGSKPITKAWKEMFQPKTMLDVGCGRGQFVLAGRNMGIKAHGFDFSDYAVGKGRVEGCKPEWLKLHDATQRWPYEDNSYDLVTGLDVMEHVYQSDLQFVIDELYRVADKYVFLQIATVDGIKEEGYILEKGEEIPLDKDARTWAGHVTVQPESFWYDRLEHPDYMPRRDMVQWFYSLTPEEVTVNWRKNTVIVLERF